ncbi:uncharacterized protein (TIGR02679 family) [Heliophilum fasciatum]|uniref:Uncharacterized protein (TIGR02679 family) n=1 Tax=Heliophilum fasciatum TaxID=35700 RepID=A0A4V2SX62_9FIRM|nr:uncharacterized protein (TIGR02679 family) [Heliophilum fasciatum]
MPDDLRRYLAQPGLVQLLRAARERVEALGRIGGSLRLANLTVEAGDRLDGFFGRHIPMERGPVTIRLAEIDQVLQRSRWQVTLTKVLEGIDGPIRLRPQQRQQCRQAWKALLAGVQVQVSGPAREWVEAIAAGGTGGYRILKSAFDQDPAAAERQLWAVVTALERLEPMQGETEWRGDIDAAASGESADVLADKSVVWGNRTSRSGRMGRLPIFAAEITGDPHAFDRDTPLGRLFYAALVFWLRREEQGAAESEESEEAEATVTESVKDSDAKSVGTSSAEVHRTLLQEAGLEGDDISSFVSVFGLVALPDDPLAPLLKAAYQAGQPINLTLRNLQGGIKQGKAIRRWAMVAGQAVYIVENPAIFSALLDRYAELRGQRNAVVTAPLICSSGQLSMAALWLLDSLITAGCQLYYSGDFDRKGLEIALQLTRRYKIGNGVGAFQTWRFNQETYRRAKKAIHFSDEDRECFEGMTIPWDRELPKLLAKTGMVAYQENFWAELAMDWLGE